MSDASEREKIRFAKMTKGDPLPRIDRSNWPPELRGASGRDAFLWYICQAWGVFMGGDDPVENLLDSDLGHHVLRRGAWQLTLVNIEQYPSESLDQKGEQK